MAFRKTKGHRLLLEYDDVRSGTFEPLRHAPGDKFVLLGLITTKTPCMETQPELIERIRDASRFVRLERLGLRPQCGFAPSVIGNCILLEDEKRTLRLLMKTAGWCGAKLAESPASFLESWLSLT